MEERCLLVSICRWTSINHLPLSCDVAFFVCVLVFVSMCVFMRASKCVIEYETSDFFFTSGGKIRQMKYLCFDLSFSPFFFLNEIIFTNQYNNFSSVVRLQLRRKEVKD